MIFFSFFFRVFISFRDDSKNIKVNRKEENRREKTKR